MESLQDSLAGALDWLGSTGIRVAAIVIGGSVAAYVLARLSRAAAGRLFRRGITSLEVSEWGEARRLLPRLRTLETLVNRTIASVVAAIVLLLVASESGLRIEPILASAGLVGIAIAFGSQTLVRDALSGVFLVMDGTYNVGDYVRINTVEGVVTDISLRRTQLTNDDGTVHTIPNGAIVVISNYTREVVHHSLTLRLGRDTPLEDLQEVLAELTSQFSTAPEIEDDLVGAPTITGITAFRGSTYDVEIRSSVRPNLRQRWPRLFSGQLMRALERRGIDLPD